MKLCLIAAVVALVLLARDAFSLPLPKYIKACKLDKNINSCAIKSGNEAWASIVNGDPKYRIPVLDPMEVTELRTNSGNGRSVILKVEFKNAKIHGLKSLKLLNAKIYPEKNHFEFEILIPRWNLLGDYNMDGRFLLLPITGNGKANVTLENVKTWAKIDYSLEKRKGVEYIKILKTDLSDYTVSRMYTYFDNLFNGNKALGDNTNAVINENWEEFVKDLGPSFSTALNSIFYQVLNGVVGVVPHKEVILP